MLATLAFLVLAQDPGMPTTAPEATPQPPAAEAPAVVEPTRLALTPKLDGTLGEEEWDELTPLPDGTSYLQWEPGKLYVAAKTTPGRDVILSLDTNNDGWLVGRDNLEIRLHQVDGKPAVTARLLDASRREGPVWEPLPGFSLTSRVVASTDGAVMEATVMDPGTGVFNPRDNQSIGVRVDVVEPNAPEVAAFVPRALTTIRLAMQRASAIPTALRWGIEGVRVVQPNDSTRIRFTFNGTDEIGIRRIAMRTEGFAKEDTNLLEKPFPAFDNKRRAFVDYNTVVSRAAEPGYRIARAQLSFNDGPEALIQSSYRIAPLVDFDLTAAKLMAGPRQTVKVSFYIRSNTSRRVDGAYRVTPPPGFEIKAGNEGEFIIYNSRGSIRRVLTIEIPENTSGTFPFTFKGMFGLREVEQTGWLTIAP